MDCLSCKSLSGERRISPGPFIYEGRGWVVDHAYPSAMKGWLVLVTRRHVEALHELTSEEFDEMGRLLEIATRVLRETFNCRKEYVMCLAESPGFNHIHVHVVPRPDGLPDDLKGPRIFAMLQVTEEGAVPRDEIIQLSEELRSKFANEQS